jgi:hypothetical protein
MIRALGYSETLFSPHDPGRLCRGRERWIEPYPLPGAGERSEPNAPEDGPSIHRIVVSGAAFTDDGAADARRGLAFSGIDVADLITTLFPRRGLLAFMEDGHPADIPAEAQGVEAYEGYRAGGRTEVGQVRWHLAVEGAAALRELLATGPADERVRGFVVHDDLADADALAERIFPLVGFSTLDSPPARYQPSALPDLLEVVEAVVLLHRDKHGPAVAVYAREPIPKLREKLEKLTDKESVLLVPFAIPPMLARWDRALAELRADWMRTRTDEFPVPPAPEPAPHERPRGRGWRFREESEEGPAEMPNLEEPPAAADGVESEE